MCAPSWDLLETFSPKADAALLAKLEAANATELARLSDAIKTAEESGGERGVCGAAPCAHALSCCDQESEGESEICSAMLAKAELLVRTGGCAQDSKNEGGDAADRRSS